MCNNINYNIKQECAEISKIIEMLHAKKSISEIAEALCCTVEAVQKKLEKLKDINPQAYSTISDFGIR